MCDGPARRNGRRWWHSVPFLRLLLELKMSFRRLFFSFSLCLSPFRFPLCFLLV